MNLFNFKKYRFTLISITAIIGLFFCVPLTWAHPLDITATELHVLSGDKQIVAHTYIHPFLVGILLKENNISYNTTDDYYNHKKVIVDYLNSRLTFKNNNAVCRISSVNFPLMDEFEIMGGGMEMDYNIDCSAEIAKLDFVNKLFIEYSDLQTNKMVFFKDGEMQTFTKDGEDQMERIMTAKITSSSFDFKNTGNNNIRIIDTDKDGLGDDEEILYGTDLSIPDSDFDGYTDKEEVYNGWDPKDWKISPGQKEKVTVKEAEKRYNEHYGKKIENVQEEPIKTSDQIQENPTTDTVEDKINQPLSEGLGGKSAEEEAENIKDEINGSSTKEIVITSEEKSDNSKSDSAKYFNTGRLQKFLEKIKLLFDKGDAWSLTVIFALIYVLGVLHALESGHGKSILISYLVEHDKGMKDAFLFSGVMTVTHLTDVIILSLVFKIFSVATDIYNYVNDIQRIGACILLAMGIYYLIKNFIPQRQYERWKSYKKAAWLGIIAGLAPCTIGWAIMVIMLSIGKINLIIPVIIFFGLGIWTTLLFFGFVVVKIKNKFISRLKGLTRVTSVLSALMLIIIAIVLLIK